MRVTLLAHGGFPDRAKTAVGVLRFGDDEVVAVLDRDRADTRVRDHVDDVRDAPVVATMADAPACDALVIGVAPIGGGFDPSWRPDVRAALERGCDVIAGLHYRLADDEAFERLAEAHGGSLRDVRDPPDDLGVATGAAASVDATVVATVGTDCSTGKMTTAMTLASAARDRGVDAAVVPTGQTGILIEGWGIAVDRVIADFAAGATERMVIEAAADADLVVVEGQGALWHPAYSGVTAAILHGARPDALVLCHAAGRDVINGYEPTRIPPLDAVTAGYESFVNPVTPADVVAGALDTHGIESVDAARDAVEAYARSLGVPATDPLRFGVEPVVEALP